MMKKLIFRKATFVLFVLFAMLTTVTDSTAQAVVVPNDHYTELKAEQSVLLANQIKTDTAAPRGAAASEECEPYRQALLEQVEENGALKRNAAAAKQKMRTRTKWLWGIIILNVITFGLYAAT